jgi:hypothetical protein
LNIHFAGNPANLTSLLQKQGWQPAEMLGWSNLLRLLSSSAGIDSLPILPQVHDARHEALVMVKPLSTDQRLLLRLWSTPLVLDHEGLDIYIGNVTLQGAENVMGMLSIPRTLEQYDQPLNNLRQALKPNAELMDTDSPKLIRLILRPDQLENGSFLTPPES